MKFKILLIITAVISVVSSCNKSKNEEILKLENQRLKLQMENEKLKQTYNSKKEIPFDLNNENGFLKYLVHISKNNLRDDWENVLSTRLKNMHKDDKDYINESFEGFAEYFRTLDDNKINKAFISKDEDGDLEMIMEQAKGDEKSIGFSIVKESDGYKIDEN